MGIECLGVIARLFVAPAARGDGVADALLRAALPEARRRGLRPVLDVTLGNPAAIAFYEHRGWTRVGEATLDLVDPPGATLAMALYVGPEPVDVAAVDDAAARALPASEAVPRGGWLLRATPRVPTRRLNSVIARDDDPVDPLEQRIDAVERFYAARDRPARFYLTPVSRPRGLRAALLARGYAHESTTLVRVGEAATIAGRRPPTGLEVTLEATPAARWLTTWCAALGGAPERAVELSELCRRIPSLCAFALVSDGGLPLGVGMAVRDGRHIGIFNMATLPQARRRGVAGAALRALAVWGADAGATIAYLQVDEANRAALSLYGRVGLRAAYRYEYFVRGEGESPARRDSEHRDGP